MRLSSAAHRSLSNASALSQPLCKLYDAAQTAMAAVVNGCGRSAVEQFQSPGRGEHNRMEKARFAAVKKPPAGGFCAKTAQKPIGFRRFP